MRAVGGWRSADAERRFRAMEDELWTDRGLPDPDVLSVETAAGTTRLYRWPGEGEPIVFLHGMGGTGLTWAAYVERLADRIVDEVVAEADRRRGELDADLARHPPRSLDLVRVVAVHDELPDDPRRLAA